MISANVKPYHEHLMTDADSIYVALIFVINILIRDCANHDDEAKQAHLYVPAEHLFQLRHYLEQCTITPTALLSDRRVLDFNIRTIDYYTEDLNF